MRKKILVAAFTFVAALASVIPGKTTKAACTTQTGTYYKNATFYWDMNGDKRNEKVEFRTESYGSGNDFKVMKVYVNGKLSNNMKYRGAASSFEIDKFRLDNGTEGVFIKANASASEKDGYGRILQYNPKRGRFTETANMDTDLRYVGYHLNPCYKGVSGNKVIVKSEAATYGFGTVQFVSNYRYKKGKICLENRTSSISSYQVNNQNGMKTVRLLGKAKVYKDAGGKKYKKTLSAGTTVKATKVYITKSYSSYYLEGKGWYKVNNRISFGSIFAGLQFFR